MIKFHNKYILISLFLLGFFLIFIFFEYNNFVINRNTRIIIDKQAQILKARSWFWQLDGKLSLNQNVDVYDVDPDNVTKQTIQKLHSQGKFVICYISVGTVEKFREYYNKFPKEVIGKPLKDWPDEYWLNIKEYKKFWPIILQNFQNAASIGCDAIEADNIDVYKTGAFNISQEDIVNYIKNLSHLAHLYNMLFGLKNSGELVPKVETFIDFAIVEECQAYDECNFYSKLARDLKPVFAVEYNVNKNNYTQICNNFKDLNFIGAIACKNLNGCWYSCN